MHFVIKPLACKTVWKSVLCIYQQVYKKINVIFANTDAIKSIHKLYTMLSLSSTHSVYHNTRLLL